VAQGLGFGAGVPVLPIDTLLAVADEARAQTGAERVVALLDARMDEVYFAGYEWLQGRWLTRQAPALGRPEDVAVPAGWALAGNVLQLHAGRLPAAAAQVPALPTARALLRLARRHWRTAPTTPPRMPCRSTSGTKWRKLRRSALPSARARTCFAARPRWSPDERSLQVHGSGLRAHDRRAAGRGRAIERRAYGHPWTRGNFSDSLRSGYQAQMLCAGDTIIGYFVAMQGVDEVHLLNITVDPPYQGQGWGCVLLDALALWARSQRAQWLWLEVRTSNARCAGRVPALRDSGGWANAATTTRPRSGARTRSS
jgi:ribosomal-protein-alanine N-acetyltransferase